MKQGKTNWVLTYSGGKDSSAVLFLVLQLLKDDLLDRNLEKLTIIYNDTLLEIPPLHENALKVLDSISQMADQFPIPIEVVHTKPYYLDTFWSYIIGRGYPPPHQRFRWCVDRLKIRPSEKILENFEGKSTVVITGVRFGESKARDQNLKRLCSRGGECGQGIFYTTSEKFQQSYLAPIAYWAECEVWDFLNFIAPRFGWEPRLSSIYQGNNTRFGCWTCTVIKRDKTMEQLVQTPEGKKYEPLLEFRNWLKEIGDNKLHPENRVIRLDGKSGRLKLRVRREILRRLLEVQEETGLELISPSERKLCEGLMSIPSLGDSYSTQ